MGKAFISSVRTSVLLPRTYAEVLLCRGPGLDSQYSLHSSEPAVTSVPGIRYPALISLQAKQNKRKTVQGQHPALPSSATVTAPTLLPVVSVQLAVTPLDLLKGPKYVLPSQLGFRKLTVVTTEMT